MDPLEAGTRTQTTVGETEALRSAMVYPVVELGPATRTVFS